MRGFGRSLLCGLLLGPAFVRASEGPDLVPSLSADSVGGDTQGTSDAKPAKPPIEYVQYRGAFDDMPLETIVAEFRRTYPVWIEKSRELQAADFLAEVERENR